MAKKTKKGGSKKKTAGHKKIASKASKGGKRQRGVARRAVSKSNQLIAQSALKDVFKRQGSHRVRGGALDGIPAAATEYIYQITSIALRSMVMDRRQTCHAKDVDVALATRGEACY